MCSRHCNIETFTIHLTYIKLARRAKLRNIVAQISTQDIMDCELINFWSDTEGVKFFRKIIKFHILKFGRIDPKDAIQKIYCAKKHQKINAFKCLLYFPARNSELKTTP